MITASASKSPPAFNGLGAPYWKSDVRGLICGLLGTTKAEHIVRAGLEAIAYQMRDIIMPMLEDAQIRLEELRVDGGPANNKFLMQFTAEPVVSLFTDATAPDGAEVVRMGGQYLHGYAWDCLFAGIHFCFSGYFCACGKSGLSFLHNSIAILLVRIPGAFLASAYFPENLFPMGLATSAGSLLSVVICVIAFRLIAGRGK